MTVDKKNYVLIIEDDEDIRELFCEIFESASYEVKCAENGKIGFEILESDLNNNSLPELILIDMLMPVMSGLDFIKLTKEKHPTTIAKLPYIITSAKDHPEFSNLDMGENFRILKKPMDIDTLLNVANEHIKNFR